MICDVASMPKGGDLKLRLILSCYRLAAIFLDGEGLGVTR